MLSKMLLCAGRSKINNKNDQGAQHPGFFILSSTHQAILLTKA